MTCLPLPFACNSVINTHKVFRFRNSLCGGGRMTCLPFPFAVMTTHKAFQLQLTLRRRPRDVTAIAIRRPIHIRRSASAMWRRPHDLSAIAIRLQFSY